MSEFDVDGIKVKFPYDKPYDVQKIYMEKVIESLKTKQTAFLESPTGTGKTFCLLCPTLAYIEHLKEKFMPASEITLQGESKNRITESVVIPQVIFASRTHTQVSQAMKELRRSAYKDMKCAVVGSREHLCKHPQLVSLNNEDKTKQCRVLRKNGECPFMVAYVAKM